MNFTNQEKEKLIKLRRAAMKSNRKCFNSDCKEPAILSHVHQKNGPLLEISTNGKLYSLEDLNYHSRGEGNYYKFKERGFDDKNSPVIKFRGFCNFCDSKIFESIEEDSDFFSYECQLLYSYRTFLGEYAKVRDNILWYKKIFESDLRMEIIESYLRNFCLYSTQELKYKNINQLFERDINLKTQSFIFHTYEMPRIDICSSIYFSKSDSISSDELNNQLIQSIGFIKPPIGYNFFNLIPYKNNSYAVFGTIGDNKLVSGLFFEEIKSATLDSIERLITDIIIKYGETWFVSHNLYNRWSSNGHDEKIIKLINDFFPYENKYKVLDFNLFK
jgi:hypothetical protein